MVQMIHLSLWRGGNDLGEGSGSVGEIVGFTPANTDPSSGVDFVHATSAMRRFNSVRTASMLGAGLHFRVEIEAHLAALAAG